MTSSDLKWTNQNVLGFASNHDPIELITQKAKDKVLNAIQNGWQGPPFDPFQLADQLGIQTIPREDVLDARLIPVGRNHLNIEYNPNRSRGRLRFSIAHEIAHSLFPNCHEQVRNRTLHSTKDEDEWQLELLCNIAAGELLMPVGDELHSQTPVVIDNILQLQKQFDVSTEAISIRLVKITQEPCTLFTSSRVSDNEGASEYRTEYCVTSRTSNLDLPRGLLVQESILGECTAVGYTAKGLVKVSGNLPELYLECVGIPPYPGKSYPRVLGFVRTQVTSEHISSTLNVLRGNALEPRGSGQRIIAQIVNNKTPNWGAGFGKAVRNSYPIAQMDFRKWSADDPKNLQLGNVHAVAIEDNLYVVNMVAQHGFGESKKPRIRYEALRNCLIQLKEIALSRRASVHMPRIGTGYAGGNWSFILELIDEILVRNNVDVSIYVLPDYKPTITQGSLV